MKKSLAILLSLMIAVTLIFPASATELGDLTPMDLNPIDTEEINVLNELTARSTVTKYFNERLAFLKGEISTISVASSAVCEDESRHRGLVESEEITLLNSAVVFNTVWCTDLYARVELTETLSYSDSGESQTEVIQHKIKVAYDSTGAVVVTSDGYTMSCTSFSSAAYVPENIQSYTPLVAEGGRYCMRDIALPEEGNGPHKYRTWYHGTANYTEQLAWCAIFVSWCARQSNVSTDVIPTTAKVGTLLNHFIDESLFSSRTMTPTIGCIYFEGESVDSYDHVGIIVAIDTNYIWIIEGNYNNQVNYRAVSRTSTDYIGFGRPAYATIQHNTGAWYYDQYSHWRFCESCDLTVDSGNHVLGSWQIDTSQHWRVCSTCSHTIGLGSHSYSGWGYNTTYHWKACTSCGYKVNNATHTATGGWIYDSSQHWKTCSVCGGRTSVASHTYTAGYCSTCRYNPNISIDNIPGMERSPK